MAYTDLSPKEHIARIIRVDHAGEYGAKRIYQGQRRVLGRSAAGPVIEEMQRQEEEHLNYFEKEMVDRRVRPSVLTPLWHLGGYALGVTTALLGEKAAMACTVAVEEVIEDHYNRQLDWLDQKPEHQELAESIRRFRDDELHHRDVALDHHAEQTPFYGALSKGVKTVSKAAIWLAERL